MDEQEVVCEEVTLRWGDEIIIQLVQYELPDDTEDRETAIAALSKDWEVSTKPHDVVGPEDDPAVSWADLVDIAQV